MTIFEDLWAAFQYGLFPVLIAVMLATLPVYFVARHFLRKRMAGTSVYIVAFGFLGGFLGYAAGASEQSIVGAVLPTLITLISLMLGFVFSKSRNPRLQSVIPYCFISLILGSLLCLFLGGQVKRKNEEYTKKYNEWLLHYEKVDLELQKAESLRSIEQEAK